MIRHWRRSIVGHRGQSATLVVAMVLGLGLGALFATVTPARYESESTVYVAAQVGGLDDLTAAYNGTLLSQQKVKSYVELLGDSRLTEDVAQRLGGGRDALWVSGHLTGSSPTETAIIRLDAQAESPQSAQALAAAGADSLIDLIGTLEQPARNGDAPPVVARLMRPATFGPAPVSPVLWFDLLLGAIGGLVVGAGLLLAARALDRSVRSPGTLAAVGSAPVLGAVPRDRGTRSHPLSVPADASSAQAEAFRRIRTNLAFLRSDRPMQVLLLTSAQPREGLSVTAANLAHVLALAGRRVLLIGGDMRSPGLTRYLDAEDEPGLSAVLAGRAEPDAAIRRVGGIDLLPAGPLPPDPGDLLVGSRAADLVDALRPRYDHILIDTPPVLAFADAVVLSSHVDATLLVVRHGRTSTSDVAAAAAALRAGPAPLVGTILTMTPAAGEPSAMWPALSDRPGRHDRDRPGREAPTSAAAATDTGRDQFVTLASTTPPGPRRPFDAGEPREGVDATLSPARTENENGRGVST